MTTFLCVLLLMMFVLLALVWSAHTATFKENQLLREKCEQQNVHIENFGKAFDKLSRPWELHFEDPQIVWLGGIVLTGVQRILEAENKPPS